MKKILSRLPVGAGCLSLAFISLGILIKEQSIYFFFGFGTLSMLLALLVIAKLLFFPAELRNILSDPIQVNLLPALPMAFMLLSAQIFSVFAWKPMIILWFVSIAFHLFFIIWFTVKFFLKRIEIQKIHGCCFITYVGISAAAVSAPPFGTQQIAIPLLWFAFGCGVILFLYIGYRYIKYPVVVPAAKPFFCIFAAPVSIVLVGYLQSSSQKNFIFVVIMYILSTILYIISLIRCFTLIGKGFYPSHASFTFPFCISATACKQTLRFLFPSGIGILWINTIVFLEIAIALVFCVFVLFEYIKGLMIDKV